MTYTRTVDNCPDKSSASTNFVYVSARDPLAEYKFVELGGIVYSVAGHSGVADDSIALNSVQRKILRVSVRDPLPVAPYVPPRDLPAAALIYGEINYIVEKRVPTELVANDIIDRFIRDFKDQILNVQQHVYFELQGGNYKLQISSVLEDNKVEQRPVQRGLLKPNTCFVFTNPKTHPIQITGQKGYAMTQVINMDNFNFEKLGIGGLDAQFEAIFRRAFASRVFPPSIVQRLGIQHVKGLLLFGPPGTGKTLIARQIGKVLNGREPKIVNGPEVLSKYVGQAEENIRNLFGDAEAEYKEKGDDSELHIIIFDEIDAICKARGSVRDGTGVHDTVVNQLLTKVDGVDSLNNILLIGMTNRRDMLDEALLRPGRLEVQIEIGLPDQPGRLQILKIHTSKMSTNSFLDRGVDLERLSAVTKNFSGAELEGLVKDAAAYALNRNVDLNNLRKPVDEDNIKVTMSDFEEALKEVKPAFGAATETLETYYMQGIIPCGDIFEHLQTTLHTLVEQVRTSAKTPLLSCLLEGPAGSGKSALAAYAAVHSGFPYVKVVSPENLVGFSEQAKASQITKIFEDAYRSQFSVIILDDIERLLEYVAIGPRFSNIVLQVLLVLVKKVPPSGRRLLVVGTTSAGEVMDLMGLSAAFNVNLHVPSLGTEEVVRVLRALDVFEVRDIPQAVESLTSQTSKHVPFKKLLLWVEMARQDLPAGSRVPVEKWQRTLRDLTS